MQQRVPLGHVVNVGSRADDGVNQTRFSVHADMGLHSEVPLVAFFGLVHLGVTLTTAVLGGARCSNQCRVNHCSCLEHQALGGQGDVDGGQL